MKTRPDTPTIVVMVVMVLALIIVMTMHTSSRNVEVRDTDFYIGNPPNE